MDILWIAVSVAAAAMIVIMVVAVYSRVPLEKKYENSGGGLGGAFEAVWMPSAHEAGIERDRQTKRTAPAPAPGDPPSTISDTGRIVLDL
ncbi:hypothetical protein ACI3KS_02015 [Microbacterium sp. ZW T5_45]|uniref:hypothetical protein n=1 Tax=Microbacterium sp. ZW T5_45 TaxID=3378080 RepID=UPI003854E2B7